MERQNRSRRGRGAGPGGDPAALAHWLGARLQRAPVGLRARMQDALDGIDSSGEPSDTLLEAAAACIARAVALQQDRRAALDLLAADGLLTIACDAATDAGEFARRASARLAALLPAVGTP
ncbi:MAG: hypothetical protein L0271_18850 [Gemmatimonadetes bacterium]|nr:hypothetical protein [Gemmatimonadota bacterium]